MANMNDLMQLLQQAQGGNANQTPEQIKEANINRKKESMKKLVGQISGRLKLAFNDARMNEFRQRGFSFKIHDDKDISNYGTTGSADMMDVSEGGNVYMNLVIYDTDPKLEAPKLLPAWIQLASVSTDKSGKDVSYVTSQGAIVAECKNAIQAYLCEKHGLLNTTVTVEVQGFEQLAKIAI